MHEQRTTIFDLDRQFAIVDIQITQQQRLIDGLRDSPQRVEALSAYAELLRAQYDLQCYRDQLKKQFSRKSSAL